MEGHVVGGVGKDQIVRNTINVLLSRSHVVNLINHAVTLNVNAICVLEILNFSLIPFSVAEADSFEEVGQVFINADLLAAEGEAPALKSLLEEALHEGNDEDDDSHEEQRSRLVHWEVSDGVAS